MTISRHPFNCRKVGRVQLSSNFFVLLSLIRHSRARFEDFFEVYIKSGNITEKKNKTFNKRFLIFLNTKMSAKSNKIELIEEFMVMLREEQTLWDAMSPSHWDKNEKDKSFRSSHPRCSLKKALLKILQIHRKTPVPESIF